MHSIDGLLSAPSAGIASPPLYYARFLVLFLPFPLRHPELGHSQEFLPTKRHQGGATYSTTFNLPEMRREKLF